MGKVYRRIWTDDEDVWTIEDVSAKRSAVAVDYSTFPEYMFGIKSPGTSVGSGLSRWVSHSSGGGVGLSGWK